LHGAPGRSPLLVFTKIHPSKIFAVRKFFPACPIFANKNFSVFNEKIRQKGLRPARPKACKVGQSILTDESADRDFSNRKKSLISRLLAPTSPKAQKKPFSNGENG